MKIENKTEGMSPTAKFIADQHTGKFVQILPNTYIIKGAVNNRGFDQAYAVSKFKNRELVLIDVVQEATREAVETLVKDGYQIKAIIITGETVLNEAYADLQTLSKDAGGAAIYIHPQIIGNTQFETKPLPGNDALLNEFHLITEEIPASTKGEVLVFASNNQGMLFVGDSAKGSAYDTDEFLFSREEQEKDKEEFDIAGFWQGYDRKFSYFFPRKGKPAIEVDNRTRTTLLDRLSRKSS